MARPVTKRQWQDAVNVAQMLTDIEAGRLFGLIFGESFIDLESCFWILAEGRERGILPNLQQRQTLLPEARNISCPYDDCGNLLINTEQLKDSITRNDSTESYRIECSKCDRPVLIQKTEGATYKAIIPHGYLAQDEEA